MPSEARGRQLVETKRGGFERDFIPFHPTWRLVGADRYLGYPHRRRTGQTTAADDANSPPLMQPPQLNMR